MDIVERLRGAPNVMTENGYTSISKMGGTMLNEAADEIERLREDLDLTRKIARIEIDAKIRYAWALHEIVELKPDPEFGAVPIQTAQDIARAALKEGK